MKISKTWESFHGTSWPIAYLLRQKRSACWLRFHSLPDSQRYAKNEAETREILHRADVLATEILEQAPCLFFFPDYASAQVHPLRGHFFGRASGEDLEITLLSSVARWDKERFEAILRAVADDEVRYVSWMNCASGDLFAPYDGGFDLFFQNPERRDNMRSKHLEWLSKHPQGL